MDGQREDENIDNFASKQYHSYNEALSLAGLGKFHYFLLLTCGLCLMSVIVETLNIGFVIPLIDYECDLKLTLNEKGFLSASAFAGVVTSSYLWGFFADKSGRHKVMIICSFFGFIFSFLSSFSVNVWMLIITRFFVGFFISGLAANTYAYLGEFHSDKNRAKQLNFSGIFMAFALTFCPALGWIILRLRNEGSTSFYLPFINISWSFWRLFLVICSSISLLITIFMYFLPESPKFLLVHQKHDLAVKILKKIYRINRGSHLYPVSKIEIDEQLVHSQDERNSFFKQLWSQTTPLFRSPYLTSTWKLSFILFSFFSSSSGFFLWVPEILNQLMDYPNHTVCEVVKKVIERKQNSTISGSCSTANSINEGIYEITFLMGLFFSIVYFIDGLVINKLGKRNLLAFWLTSCGLSGILIPFYRNHYALLLLLVIFLTSGVCGSIVSACIVDIYPTNIRAISLCVILIIARIGAIAGSIFVSFVIESHCVTMFEIFGGFLIVAAIVACLIRN